MNLRRPLLWCALAAGLLAQNGMAAKVALTPKAIEINLGSGGVLDMQYPAYNGDKGSISPREVTLAADKKSASLEYPDGAAGSITLKDDAQLVIQFSHLPQGVKTFKMNMQVPINFNAGGTYEFSDTGIKPFPHEKPEKPFLYQGHSQQVTLTHPAGEGVTIKCPPYGFMQLQDNRQWNWAVFSWFAQVPIDQKNPATTYTFTFGAQQATAEKKVLIDRYGQWVSADFPEKVKSDDDLRGDVERDRVYYALLNPPATDSFGGVPGTKETYNLKATGYFYLAKINGRDVLVTPEGNAFFQLGMCGVSPIDDYTTVKGRQQIYEWLPPLKGEFSTAYMAQSWNPGAVFSFHLANEIRKFGRPYDAKEYVSRWVDRLRKWGFNSGGAWAFSGDARDVLAEKKMPYVSFLPLGKDVAPEIPGVKGVWDPFADGVNDKMAAAFKKGVAPQADNPLIIGWFITNEPSIEDVAKIVPGLKGSKSAAKRELVAMLKGTYSTIDAFNTAWEVKAENFDALAEMPLNVTTLKASQDMLAFFRMFLERRYSLITENFRKVNTHHLLLGDRWMPGTANNQALVETAGKYLDIISVNYYTNDIDQNFLKRIHQWAGNKPLLLSEFHFCARDQGLTGGARQVASQQERGLAYRNYVEQAASTGFVVGIQWFIAIDQAATGRWFDGFNGESANTGLVNVADRPYKEFLAEVIKTNYDLFGVITGKRSAFVFDDPRFTQKRGARRVVTASQMAHSFAADGLRGEWPMMPPVRVGPENLVLGTPSQSFEMTYRIAWDSSNLYVFAEVIDSTPMKNDRKAPDLWSADSLELFIGSENIEEGGSLKFGDRQILLRGAPSAAGMPAGYLGNAPKQVEIISKVIPSTDGRGYTLEAAIPFAGLGITPKVGQTLLFDIGVNDSGDGRTRRQLMWNGTDKNSKDRSAWGHLVLNP